ncbi:MAG TPA: DUF3575 domain-containing protein [Flavobacteriia bacterium]|nr:DUF3575 domain-containing protein [Flavobacteriia bacterium]
MKKLFLVVALVAFSFSNAQEQAIKVNPVGVAFGVANAGYEFSLKEDQTLTIAALYYNISDISGIGAGAEYRFYFSTHEALRGWHAGPNIGFFSLEDDFNNSATVFSLGGEVGHQWIFGEHFVVDVFANLGAVFGSSSTLDVNSTAVGLGVSLGYAW